MKNQDSEWLSTDEAARSLGLVPRTIYRLINEGDVPAYRFGRVIRVRATDLDAYIERSRIQPGDLKRLLGADEPGPE